MAYIRPRVTQDRGAEIKRFAAGAGPMKRWPFTAALALATVAFSQSSPSATQRQSGLTAAEQRGLAFAEQHCSGCHAVTENGVSPNPESPSFQDVANRAGVTPSTLRQFLRDSHNYPSAMNFQIEAEQISDLADYIVTMQKPNYRPSL
jgi:mono/diheme cytochrome c family protein